MRDEQTDRPESDAPMAGRQDAAPTRPLSVDQRMAGMTGRGKFMAFQLGATLVASAGGLIVYGLLVNRQVNNFIALLIGLAFALLARRAATWLMLAWLTAQARQRGAPDDDQRDATPPPS
jgi:mannitol-specific phosphotransferase system IIBC component